VTGSVALREGGGYKNDMLDNTAVLAFLLALSLLGGLCGYQWRQLRRLRLGEARLDQALQASDAALWEWHIDEQRMVLSERYFRQLGYPPDAYPASTETWRRMLHPDDVEHAIATVRAHLKQHSDTYVNEYRMLDAAGQWRWMLARGRVTRRGPDGRPLQMVGTHIDIHAMKTRQAELLESHERFQNIYQTTPDAMGITRVSDGLYIDINEGFVRMVGYPREQVLGRTSNALGIWARPEQRDQLVAEFRRQGWVDSMEMQVRRRDGQLLDGLMTVRPLVERGDDCMLFIYRDITERRRLLREAEAAAAASQAKTEFLSRMSHELRTPLNAVLGFAQLLQASPSLAGAERERAQLAAILQAGWHLLNLINDVLDIARIESGHLQLQLRPLALRPVLAEALTLLQGEAEAAGVQLPAEPPPCTERWLMGDALRLRQALVNVLSNAIKYNHRGGRVLIACEAREGRLLLQISDTGRGMDAAQQAHLFEPFNRLGREREGIDGTGIGLVLTKHLLGLMGAAITLRSAPGEGTTVGLDLALVEAAPEAPTASAPPALPDEPAAQVAPWARVLYVEDSPVNQILVREMLAGWPGLELLLASDGAEGLRRAAAERPDLILLDMRLPDMDGLQLMHALRADPGLAAIPVIALSANAMPEDVAQALAAGAREYWTKPLRLQQFLADMRRVLRPAR